MRTSSSRPDHTGSGGRFANSRGTSESIVTALTPLASQLLSEHGFRHGFSPRAGGVSTGAYRACNVGRGVGDEPAHVEENRRRVAEAVGYPDARLFELSQVHGRVVQRVRPDADPAALRREEGDGLVAQLGAAVGVRSADCVPVLLADPDSRCVAALHAGWRGTALGIVQEGVRALVELSGTPPARLLAAIFPHIRVCCFEVSAEVAATLLEASPDRAVVHHAPRPSDLSAKPHVSLAAILHAQLMAAGLATGRIDDVPGCTRCEGERFFSYRRDGQASGRHLSVIVAG
jgi:polyphenol oxidase